MLEDPDSECPSQFTHTNTGTMPPATPRFSHKGTGFPSIGNIRFWLEGEEEEREGHSRLHSWHSWQLSCPAAWLWLGALAPCQAGPTETNSSLGALGLGSNRGSPLIFNPPLNSVVQKAEVQCPKLGCVWGGERGLRTAVEQGRASIFSPYPTHGP